MAPDWDLQGRLSNPPYHSGRVSQALPRVLTRQHIGRNRPVSHQLQRRLKPIEVDELVVMYEAGSSIPVVAETFSVNRATVLLHLERRGVRRRAAVRKLSDDDVRLAASRYEAGEPMATLTARFGVDGKTLRREIAATGVVLRRPGRPKRSDSP